MSLQTRCLGGIPFVDGEALHQGVRCLSAVEVETSVPIGRRSLDVDKGGLRSALGAEDDVLAAEVQIPIPIPGIGAGRDQDDVSGEGRIDGCLNGRVLGGD